MRRGTVLVEFALAGIPILFAIIAIVEISRAMWTYQTLAYAAKEATRMVVVHGRNCVTPPNACGVTVGDVANVIAAAGPGIRTDQLQVTMLSLADGNTITCSTLDSCKTNASAWPVFPGNVAGTSISVSLSYPFTSPMSLVFPGTSTLQASSQERIQF